MMSLEILVEICMLHFFRDWQGIFMSSTRDLALIIDRKSSGTKLSNLATTLDKTCWDTWQKYLFLPLTLTKMLTVAN